MRSVPRSHSLEARPRQQLRKLGMARLEKAYSRKSLACNVAGWQCSPCTERALFGDGYWTSTVFYPAAMIAANEELEPNMKLDRGVLKSLPKVLLHEHLDGGLRPKTVIDLARK